MQENHKPPGSGVRKLKLSDQLPDCEIVINEQPYDLKELAKGKRVVDIGCGYGRNRTVVEAAGGEWVGVEPFEGGNNTVKGDAENLPFPDNSFDIAVMHAVLEHVPEVNKAFSEVARVLKPGGLFVGYSAFMECFHEISYSHLSHKALEHYAEINGMKLRKISGGGAFGIDYHIRILLFPVPANYLRKGIASLIRGMLKIKSKFAYIGLRYKRKLNPAEALKLAEQYYKLECLRQSVGFNFIISNEKGNNNYKSI